MSFHMLHGCVRRWQPDHLATRNFVPEAALITFLRGLEHRYGNWHPDGRSRDVLSIDDSTRGAYRACRIARALGHEVTLFVNPHTIISKRPYWFVRLDAILDGRTVDELRFLGARYRLRRRDDVRSLRGAVKHRMRGLSDRDGEVVLGELARRVGVEMSASGRRPRIESHARPMTIEDLTRLRQLGVSIQNHGWTHADIKTMTRDEFRDHLRLAEQWLLDDLGVSATQYAVPFGTDILSGRQRAAVSGPVWIASPEHPEGPVGRGHWNRVDITHWLQPPT